MIQTRPACLRLWNCRNMSFEIKSNYQLPFVYHSAHLFQSALMVTSVFKILSNSFSLLWVQNRTDFVGGRRQKGQGQTKAYVKAELSSVHFCSQVGTKPYLGVFNIKITVLIFKVRYLGPFVYHSEWNQILKKPVCERKSYTQYF